MLCAMIRYDFSHIYNVCLSILYIYVLSVLCLSNYYDETEPKSNIRIVQVLCGNSTNYKVNMMQKYMGAKSFGVVIEGYIQEAINNGRTPDELGL